MYFSCIHFKRGRIPLLLKVFFFYEGICTFLAEIFLMGDVMLLLILFWGGGEYAFLRDIFSFRSRCLSDWYFLQVKDFLLEGMCLSCRHIILGVGGNMSLFCRNICFVLGHVPFLLTYFHHNKKKQIQASVNMLLVQVTYFNTHNFHLFPCSTLPLLPSQSYHRIYRTTPLTPICKHIPT